MLVVGKDFGVHLMGLVQSGAILKNTHIMKTSPCNVYPLTPPLYIVKLGFTGVYIIFLFLLQNINCGYSLEPPQ